MINEGHYPYIYLLNYRFPPVKYANKWNLHILGRGSCENMTTKRRSRRVLEGMILVKISGLSSYCPTGLLYPTDHAKKKKKKNLILKLE